MKLVIEGQFPTLNEIVAVSKSSYMRYANQKKEFTGITQIYARGMEPVTEKADWTFTWYRKTRRADPDNVSVGAKYIFDGLIDAGVIDGDGWKQVNSIKHEFKIDKDNPRVEVVALVTEGE